MEVIGDSVFIHLANPALLGTNTGGEIAEVVNRQRHVGGHGFADRFAVVPGLSRGQQLQVLLHAIGNLEQDRGAILHRGVRPFLFYLVGSIQRQIDIALAGTGDFAQRLAGDRGEVLVIIAVDRRNPVAADKVVITGFQFKGETIFAGQDTC